MSNHEEQANMSNGVFFLILYLTATIFLAVRAFDMLGVFLAMIGSPVAALTPVYLLSLIQEPGDPWARLNVIVMALSAGAYLYWLWTMGKGSGVSTGGMQDPYGDGE